MRLRELVAGQLAEERDELRAVYHFFCGAGQREMCLSGFLRFCDAFSLSPGYLGPDKVEEIFENCAGAAGPPRPRTRALCGLGAFEEALCLAALAVAEKQWLVEYSAEKRARFQYRLADAEKSRPERGLPDSLGELLQAMQLDQPRRWRARAAGAVATGPHASPAKAPSPQTKPRASPPRSIEERLHALRTALGVDDPNASGGGARARGRSPRRTNGDGRPGTPATGAAPAAHTPRPPPRPRVVSPREGMVPHPPDQRPPTPVAGPTQPPPARGGGGGGGGAPVTPRSSTRSPRRHRVVEGSGAPAPNTFSAYKVPTPPPGPAPPGRRGSEDWHDLAAPQRPSADAARPPPPPPPPHPAADQCAGSAAPAAAHTAASPGHTSTGATASPGRSRRDPGDASPSPDQPKQGWHGGAPGAWASCADPFMWAEAAEAVAAAANSAPVTPRTLAPGARATSASATSAGGSRRLRACGEISNTHADSRLGGGGGGGGLCPGGPSPAAGGPSTTQFFSFDSRSQQPRALSPRGFANAVRNDARVRRRSASFNRPATAPKPAATRSRSFDRAQSARSSHQGHQQRSAGMATQLAW